MSGRNAHLTLVSAELPPESVRADVGAAAQIADSLAARDRELHFDLDACGRAVVELRSLDGEVLRRLTGAEALAVMAGLADVE